VFCPNCGADVKAPVVGTVVPSAPGMPAAPQQQTSALAIASLVCACLFPCLITPILGIIFGHISLSQIKRSGGKLKGQGLAIAGLVIGYCSFIPVILIIAAIAIPNLLRARIAANESSAAATVRTIATAETTYASMYSDKGYTCELSELQKENLIEPSLASGQKTGYRFELRGCEAETPGGPNTKFQVVAYPITLNTTGMKAFCSDESAIVKKDSMGSANNCLENGETL
jgi:type II secretory pathway pseudopilin PulG